MDQVLTAEFFLKALQKVKKNKFFFSAKQKIFSQKAIFQAFLDDFAVSPNFVIFLKLFIQAGDDCDFFLIDSCLLALEVVLSEKEEHWFTIVSKYQNTLKSIRSQAKKTETKTRVDLETLKNYQKIMFFGNCLDYDKDLVDQVIVEAFVRALGCYSGKSLENCISFEWVKDFYPGPSLLLIPGLVVQCFDGFEEGDYQCVHFNER